jgi:hypothetical protein
LFGFAKYEWSGMEYDGTHSIPYHPISQFSFHPIWGVCNGMNFIN